MKINKKVIASVLCLSLSLCNITFVSATSDSLTMLKESKKEVIHYECASENSKTSLDNLIESTSDLADNYSYTAAKNLLILCNDTMKSLSNEDYVAIDTEFEDNRIDGGYYKYKSGPFDYVISTVFFQSCKNLDSLTLSKKLKALFDLTYECVKTEISKNSDRREALDTLIKVSKVEELNEVNKEYMEYVRNMLVEIQSTTEDMDNKSEYVFNVSSTTDGYKKEEEKKKQEKENNERVSKEAEEKKNISPTPVVTITPTEISQDNIDGALGETKPSNKQGNSSKSNSGNASTTSPDSSSKNPSDNTSTNTEASQKDIRYKFSYTRDGKEMDIEGFSKVELTSENILKAFKRCSESLSGYYIEDSDIVLFSIDGDFILINTGYDYTPEEVNELCEKLANFKMRVESFEV